ncbi:MAG: asparagine synthase (glutamine-hydrolyzing) [Bdellovibrionales bacterium]|nr:asparagine synthase (glutamine-hydrolyzing) [Bdellovibrionales bacterium]
MCGITGLVDARGTADRAVLEAMTGMLLHRGPDSGGLWCDREVGLGHRRLAILDLSPTGAQPMISPSGRWAVTFNGEIYNHPDLRGGLGPFRGTSDTEVLLHLLDRHGFVDTLPRLAGMFALAAWNTEERSLWLARDRMGEKPLYWAPTSHGLAFASEPKALRKNPAVDFQLHLPALKAFLNLGYIPSPNTAWIGVHQLRPGHWIRWKNGVISGPAAYWALPEGGAPSCLAEVEAVLTLCVRQQMNADVPLGAFLSGGVDSSLITALMAEQRKVRSFSIAFSESGYNEAPLARKVAERLGTDHTELLVTARDALDLVPRIPEIWDEPFADSSQIPTALLARLTRRHVTVALSGDGGDEVFAGYNRHVAAPRVWGRMSGVPLPLRAGISALMDAMPDFLAGAALSLVRPGTPQPEEKFRKLARSLRARSFLDLYRSITLLGKYDLMPGVEAPPRFHADGADILQRLDLGEYLPGDILVKVDRAAMAASLETRAPFLDHRVVEVAMRLPHHLRVSGSKGKVALRALLAKRLPEELFDRPKTGFAVPLCAWLRGPLRDWAGDLLGTVGNHSWLDAKEAGRLWRDTSQVHQLWALLMLLAWLRKSDSP